VFVEGKELTRRPALLCAALFLLSSGAQAQPTVPESSLPNIILIVVDDLGWSDLGVLGGDEYVTPNMDALSQQGVLYTNAYASSHLCSPSRASLLTGRYTYRTGVTDLIPAIPPDNRFPLLDVVAGDVLPSWEITFPELIRDRGYTTAIIGKWHLGGPGSLPEDHGFDLNSGGNDLGRPASYFDPYLSRYLSGEIGFVSREVGEHLLDRETDEVIGFVREHAERPFFLFWSSYSVHEPHEPKAEWLQRYRESHPDATVNRANYGALIAHVDDGIGRLLAELDQLNLTENTLVIVTSDNGGLPNLAASQGMRGGKGDPYEGGLRVPLIIRWPGMAHAGTREPRLTVDVDIFSTILDVAQLPAPADRPIDGVSLLGETAGDAPGREVVWHYPHYQQTVGVYEVARPYSVLREGDWKLILFHEGSVELYDLANDPGETNDLSADEQERTAAMEAELRALLDGAGAEIPVTNPRYSYWGEVTRSWQVYFHQSYIGFRTALSRLVRMVIPLSS